MINKNDFYKGDKVKLLENVVLEKTFKKGSIGIVNKPITGFIFCSDDGEMAHGVEVKFDVGPLQISPRFLEKVVEESEIKRLYKNFKILMKIDAFEDEFAVWNSNKADYSDIVTLKDFNNLIEDEIFYIKQDLVEDRN